MQKILKLSEVPFELSEIKKAYSGKMNKCMCGCSGRYYYADIKKAEDWQLDLKEQKSNSTQIKKIYDTMKKLISTQGLQTYADHDDKIFFMEFPETERQYTVYLID